MSCITANERPQSVIKPPTAAGQRKRTFPSGQTTTNIGQLGHPRTFYIRLFYGRIGVKSRRYANLALAQTQCLCLHA